MYGWWILNMNVDVIHDLWVIYNDGLIYTNWLHHNTPLELQHLPNFPPTPKIYTFLNPHPLGNIVFFYGHASTQCPQTSTQHYPSSQTSLDVFLTFPPCQEKIMDAVLVIVEHGQNVPKPFQNISNKKNSKDTLFKTSLKSQNHPWDIHTKWAIGNLGIKYSPMTIVMYSKLVIWLLIALIQIHQIALVQVISLELFLLGHMRTFPVFFSYK